MNRQDRLSALAHLVMERGTLRVEDAVEELGVSPATVRRDLDTLANQQLIVRTRGGASANPSSGELPLRYRSGAQSDAKLAIARSAAAMVVPGDVIGFNGGTTTTLTAHEVGLRVSAEEDFENDGITLVTNAINIANDLAIRPGVRVVVTGGVVRARSYELTGPLSSLILPHISVDTLFLGINALDLTHGLYTDHEGEAQVNAALASAARRVVVVADSGKIGQSAFAKIAPLAAVSAVVTDTGICDEHAHALREHGIEVVIAPAP